MPPATDHDDEGPPKTQLHRAARPQLRPNFDDIVAALTAQQVPEADTDSPHDLHHLVDIREDLPTRDSTWGQG